MVLTTYRTFTLTQAPWTTASAVITNKAQIKNLILDESLIAPNAISRMVHVNRSALIAPGTGAGKWVWQAPPGYRLNSSLTVPPDSRAGYVDYLGANISAPYAYDLYFWIAITAGDVVATIYRDAETTPYGGTRYRTVLDSHTSRSFNSGAIVGVMPAQSGARRLTLSFAGINGSIWTEVANASITMMGVMK